MRLAIDARKIADYGIGTYIRGLAGAVATLRPDWRLLLLGDPRAAWPGAHANVEWVRLRARGYGLAELVQVGRAVVRSRADLFHAPHYVYPLTLRCPGVVTIHDCIHLRFPEFLPRPFGLLPRATAAAYARWMIGRAARTATQVLTVSAATRDELLQRFDLDGRRVTAVLNGCDGFWGEAPEGDGEASGSAGEAVPARYFLWVGNPKPHKNLPRLLRAFESVHAAHPDTALILAGPESGDGLESAPGVQVVGRVSDTRLRALYRGATALVIPSLYEGFGLPALEAMAAGAPVVHASVGGLPEVVGAAGVAVDPLDAEAITAAMTRMLQQSPAEREILVGRARDRARELTWERAAAATLSVYERALETA